MAYGLWLLVNLLRAILIRMGLVQHGHQKNALIHHDSHMKEVIDLTPHSSGDSSTEEVG